MTSAVPLKTLIAVELYTAIQKLGGKSDLLGIVGSYGDTMSDDDVLHALRQWNAAHPRVRTHKGDSVGSGFVIHGLQREITDESPLFLVDRGSVCSARSAVADRHTWQAAS